MDVRTKRNFTHRTLRRNLRCNSEGQQALHFAKRYPVTEPPLFVIDAGGDRTICVGQILKIKAPEDNATYEWTSDAGFNSTAREVSLSNPAKYTLKIVNADAVVQKTASCYRLQTISSEPTFYQRMKPMPVTLLY